jgi:hypothetical protein
VNHGRHDYGLSFADGPHLSQKAAQEGSQSDEVKNYERVKNEFCGRLQKCSFE